MEAEWNNVLPVKSYTYAGKATDYAESNGLDISQFRPSVDMLDEPSFVKLKESAALRPSQFVGHQSCYIQTSHYQNNTCPNPPPFSSSRQVNIQALATSQMQFQHTNTTSVSGITPQNAQPSSLQHPMPPLPPRPTATLQQQTGLVKGGGSAFDMSNLTSGIGLKKGRAQATIKKTESAEKGLHTFIKAALDNPGTPSELSQNLLKLDLSHPQGLALLYHRDPVAMAAVVCSWLRCLRNGKKGAEGKLLKIGTLAGKVQRLQAVICDQMAEAVRLGAIRPELAPSRVILSVEGHHLWGRVYSTLDELGREYTSAGGDAFRKQSKVITPQLEQVAEQLGTFNMSTPTGRLLAECIPSAKHNT